MNTMPLERPLRILVVDYHKRVRDGIRQFCSYQSGLCVIAEAWDVQEALDLYRICRPDIVVMDSMMAGLNGVLASTLIHEIDPHARILPLADLGESQLGALTNMIGIGGDFKPSLLSLMGHTTPIPGRTPYSSGNC